MCNHAYEVIATPILIEDRDGYLDFEDEHLEVYSLPAPPLTSCPKGSYVWGHGCTLLDQAAAMLRPMPIAPSYWAYQA